MSNNNITVTISNQPLMDKITQLQQEIITLEETVTSLNAQIADLNQQVEQKQATIDSLNTQISQLQEQINQLDAQVTALTEQVQTLILENSQLTQQVESLTTENTQLTQQVESLTTENSRLTEQVQSLTSQVSQLTEQVQQLQASVESLNGQITSMTNQINTINGETVQNPIEYLSGTKSQILQALQNKGSSATESTTFREYANIISHFNVLPDGDEHTTLLLHLDNDHQLTDSSIYRRPILPCGSGTPVITTQDSKFGNGSLMLDGTCGCYVNQTNFFPLSSAGWTIELFYKPISWTYNGYYAFMDTSYKFTVSGTTITRYQRLAAEYYSSRRVISGTYLDFDRYSTSQTVTVYSNENSFQGNSWHHLAWVKNPYDSAYLTRVYHNGTFIDWYSGNPYYLIKSYQLTPFDQIPAVVYFFCCTTSSVLNCFCPCYANEIRISNVCRYTDNFTPPTEPFSS